MSIQEAVRGFHRAVQALPQADRALLAGLVSRMSHLTDDELDLDDGADFPVSVSPIETEYGPETESRMGPETEDKPTPAEPPPGEKKPDMGWETEY